MKAINPNSNVIEVESEVTHDNNSETVTETQHVEEGPVEQEPAQQRQNQNTGVMAASWPSLDPEATEYVLTPIDGAGPLMLFLGDQRLKLLSFLAGRPLTLVEAQHLVFLDGEPTVCAVEGKKFQPVGFVTITNPTEAEVGAIRSCRSLTEIKFRYAGAFYANPKKGQVAPVSGAPYYYNRAQGKYLTAYENSSLVAVAGQIKRQVGNWRWGFTRQGLQELFQKQTARRKEIQQGKVERTQKAAALVQSLFGTSNARDAKAGESSFAGAYARAEALKKEKAPAPATTKGKAVAKGNKKSPKAKSTKKK